MSEEEKEGLSDPIAISGAGVRNSGEFTEVVGPDQPWPVGALVCRV